MIRQVKVVPDRDWMTVREFARAAGCTRAWVYELIALGLLAPTLFKRKRTSIYKFPRSFERRASDLVREASEKRSSTGKVG